MAQPGWPGAYFGLKTRFLFLTMPPAAQEISAFSRAYKVPQYLLSAKSAWLNASVGRSSSGRSLRSSPRSRAAIGGGLFGLVHCWKRASKRLGTKRLGSDKGWVRPTLGTRCSLFIREHIEQAAAQQLASDISHKSIGQRACIPLRPVPLRPTLYGIPSSAPPRQ